MLMRRHVLVLVLVVWATASPVGIARAQLVPANAGNLEDGGPVDPADVLALRGANAGWLPTPSEILQADCEAVADAPVLVESNGLVLIRGWGHWNCNQALPASYLEVCLDAVFPSVSCNEKFVPPPRTSISVPVDFPCVPGIYLTMASGTNGFDTDRSNDVSHSRNALVVMPQDCRYLERVS